MGEITVAHDISHGLKANHHIRADGLRRMDTLQATLAPVVGVPTATELERLSVASVRAAKSAAPAAAQRKAG